MKFHISREACCFQDDQIGPLEMVCDLADDSTLRQLVEAVQTSRFLQFSSSHQVLVAEMGNSELVRVFAPSWFRRRAPEYTVSPDAKATEIIGDGELRFRFVFD
ncbi:MAG: hypothetical protein EOO28_05265 [Comamonadaceae bacterium]|nr:MAG: hypothetical protein EOO28_05265 [Comamonadaceae bacterium]